MGGAWSDASSFTVAPFQSAGLGLGGASLGAMPQVIKSYPFQGTRNSERKTYHWKRARNTGSET